MFTRSLLPLLSKRLAEPRRFIQVLSGPRQVGKTTLARQLMEAFGERSTYASADGPAPGDSVWLEQQWNTARLRSQGGPWLLVLDEIQKIPGWSETVKQLWDEDGAGKRDLRVVLLGSSPLLLQRGLGDSLAGRFEMTRVGHWSFAEMQAAFGWHIEQFIHFGGYPGAAGLIADPPRWRQYLLDALIETTLSRDILLMTRVDKPALLRQLFYLGCAYSGQILSYQKMQGQLQDAGNTTTLAHYLDLLAGAGMLCGLQKYAGEVVRQRASSPKLNVLNTGLMSARDGRTLEESRADPEWWGRLSESAVGAHLIDAATKGEVEVFYWRETGKEVDFVLRKRDRLTVIEVKSGRRREALPGLAAFEKNFGPCAKLLVGTGGMPIDEFLTIPPGTLF